MLENLLLYFRITFPNSYISLLKFGIVDNSSFYGSSFFGGSLLISIILDAGEIRHARFK